MPLDTKVLVAFYNSGNSFTYATKSAKCHLLANTLGTFMLDYFLYLRDKSDNRDNKNNRRKLP